MLTENVMLTPEEAKTLNNARVVLREIAKRNLLNEDHQHAGYVAGFAERAESAIFDYLNHAGAYMNDVEARRVVLTRHELS